MIAYKYKLAPSMAQQDTFSSWAGANRFIYNLCLEHRIISWGQYRSSVSYYDQANELRKLKVCENFEWLKLPPAQIFQQTLKDLDKAFKSFWKSGFGFPKYKKKGYSESFRLPEPKHFSLKKVSKNRAILRLPKIGEVKLRYSRPLKGKIRNLTIKKETDGWYASFCCEREVQIKKSNLPSCGIDRGISETLKISSGITKFEDVDLTLPRSCTQMRGRIKVLQKRLRKKKRFSNNWKREQKKIKKLHSRIAKTRQDFLHKASTYVAKNHGFVSIEDLKVKNMSKSAKGSLIGPGKNVKAKSGLNREILFQGWGVFEHQLRYKLEWSGGHLELVDPKYTSTRCSVCLFNGKKNRKNKSFKCLNCGHVDDADLNASKNIDRAGRAQCGHGDDFSGNIYEVATSGKENQLDSSF